MCEMTRVKDVMTRVPQRPASIAIQRFKSVAVFSDLSKSRTHFSLLGSMAKFSGIIFD